jgi:hypothetical protein
MIFDEAVCEFLRMEASVLRLASRRSRIVNSTRLARVRDWQQSLATSKMQGSNNQIERNEHGWPRINNPQLLNDVHHETLVLPHDLKAIPCCVVSNLKVPAFCSL